jgi:hypothetical protein
MHTSVEHRQGTTHRGGGIGNDMAKQAGRVMSHHDRARDHYIHIVYTISHADAFVRAYVTILGTYVVKRSRPTDLTHKLTT